MPLNTRRLCEGLQYRVIIHLILRLDDQEEAIELWISGLSSTRRSNPVIRESVESKAFSFQLHSHLAIASSPQSLLRGDDIGQNSI